MEKPILRHTHIGGTQFGGHLSHNRSLRFKQLESTSNVRSQRSSQLLESNMVRDIVKGFGYQEAVIQQALEILHADESPKTYASEDVLDIIYQIEDATEQQSDATFESVPCESVPQYTDEKQKYRLSMKEERNGPSDQTVCRAACAASSHPQTYESAHTNKTECNRNLEAILPESNRVLTELRQNEKPQDSRLTMTSGQERIRSEQESATYSSSHLGDCEASERTTTTSPVEDNTRTQGVSNDSKTSTDEEIFKGGNAASRKKRKKKKKGSKNKENIDNKNTNRVELEESLDNRRQTQSEKRSQVLASDQTEEKRETVCVDVRPKQPPQHSQVIKNSKTKEDVSVLVEENRKLMAAKFCRICIVNPANLLLLPCRHLACCLACGDATDNCPICDTQVIATVKIFMS